MDEKVKDVQEYLEKKGIVVAETTIIDAAIRIATRWGGNYVFVCEFEKDGLYECMKLVSPVKMKSKQRDYENSL